jgi:hypothetical protein
LNRRDHPSVGVAAPVLARKARAARACAHRVDGQGVGHQDSRMRRTLAILIAIASCGTVRADVIMPEPTQLTCGRSDVIVAGTVDGTTTPGPFTNARPPTVELTATDCFAGCSKGDRLAVARWVDPNTSSTRLRVLRFACR